MEQVTIQRIFFDEVDSKFKPGQKSPKTTIYTEEHPGVRMSGFCKVDWAPGDTVAVEITKKGNFTNFKPVSAISKGQTLAPSNLEARVAKLEAEVFGKKDVEESNDDF